MKNLLKMMMSLLILSGAGFAMADEAVVQTGKPLANTVNTTTDVNAGTKVSADTNMAASKADVGDTNSVEVNKASLRHSEMNVHEVRKDITRDIKKLKRDRVQLKTALSQKDDQATAKLKSDVDQDETAIQQDRTSLKEKLKSKVDNDRDTISAYAQKVRDTQKEVARDNERLTRDTAKLTDAQTRKAADEIEKKNAAVDKDKAMLSADTEKLNARIEYKTEVRSQLKNDRHHLDVEVKRLKAGGQVSASDTTDAETDDSATK
jgi:chromosome segregation ATPase